MVRIQNCDFYLQGHIDGYNLKRKRILYKRQENEQKEEKEKVIKEDVRKEIEVVTNKWKEIV